MAAARVLTMPPGSQATPVRLTLSRYLVVAGLLAVFGLAPRLWLDHLFFGTIPVLEGLPRIVYPLDVILFGTLILFLLPVVVVRRPRRWALVWCGLLFVRCFWDRITWQPYLYQYFFMLLTVALADRRGQRPESDPGALHILRFIVISVYFWSGLSKFNYAFLHSGMEAMFRGVMRDDLAKALQDYVIVIPLLETMIALGLLIPRTRFPALLGAVAMHASILWMIGPLGLDYNRVVWPWNIVMVGLLLILFWREREATARDILGFRSRLLHKIVLVFFVLCPGLSFFGLWPDYLAFKLYAGNYSSAAIFVSESLVERLPEETRSHVTRQPVQGFAGLLEVPYWSERELGAFAPPDPAVFRHAARRLCRIAKIERELVLLIHSPPSLWSGEVEVRSFTCRDF